VIERAADLTAPAAEYDAVIGAMSLNALFCPSVASIVPPPYVAAPEERVAALRERLAGFRGFRVGICWAGDPSNQWNPHRSCRMVDLAEAVSRPGVDLFSLQVGAGSEQLAERPSHLNITDLGADFRDLCDTAAAVMNLDLVIAVDTSTAHLAGALGSRCWTLLSCRAPWVWMEEREDSPWYPSMRLFRQQSPGDWASAFGRLSAELDALVASR